MKRPSKPGIIARTNYDSMHEYMDEQISRLEEYANALNKYCDLLETENKLLHQSNDGLMKINEHLRNDKIDGLILTDEEAMKFTGNGWVSINAYKKKLDEIDKLEHQADVDRLTIDCESATIEQYRKTIDTCEKEIINLKQALDRATDELARDGKMIGMTKDFIMYSRKATKDEWREYLLNED